MAKIISPQNNVIVQLAKKHEDMIQCANGIILYKDTTFHPEEHVMIEAKVISIPRSIIRRADYEGYSELPDVGDTILTRYDVVFSYVDQPDNANPIYKNLFDVDGQEYWMVDVMQIFAVKETHGYRMLNGYVMCATTAEGAPAHQFLVLPEFMQLKTRKDRLLIRHIGAGYFREGDIVFCNPHIVQEYRTFDDSFCIVKQSHLQAISL